MNNWNKCNEKLPNQIVECVLIYKRCGKIANWDKSRYDHEKKRIEYFDYNIGNCLPLDFFEDFS